MIFGCIRKNARMQSIKIGYHILSAHITYHQVWNRFLIVDLQDLISNVRRWIEGQKLLQDLIGNQCCGIIINNGMWKYY